MLNGLRINGEAIKLQGGCLHHDNGVLGAAAIDRAEERRVELMKSNGFNALRCSHNPPSPGAFWMPVTGSAFWSLMKPSTSGNARKYHRIITFTSVNGGSVISKA